MSINSEPQVDENNLKYNDLNEGTLSEISFHENEESIETVSVKSVQNRESGHTTHFKLSTIKQDIQVGECMVVEEQKLQETSLKISEAKERKTIHVELHDAFSSNSSIMICDGDQKSDDNEESELTKYLKKKNRHRRRKRHTLSRGPNGEWVKNQPDNFKLIRRCLSPMKKRTIFRSKSRSKNSSNAHSRSSSRQNSPIKGYLGEGKLSKTQYFYKHEMLDEIRTYIYSDLRRKLLQKKHKETLRRTHNTPSLRKYIRENHCCAECLKVSILHYLLVGIYSSFIAF